MPLPLKLALAVHMLLLLTKEGIPSSQIVLPLGGSHFFELGILIVMAVAYMEFQEIYAALREHKSNVLGAKSPKSTEQ